jgi:DegV family protein with EDD domain
MLKSMQVYCYLGKGGKHMPKFAVVADACTDIPLPIVNKLELNVVPMVVTIGDKTYLHYPDERNLKIEDFYQMLREKATPKTSQPNANEVLEVIEPLLKAGQDVLVMSISSQLSQTYNSMNIAVTELREKFPERKIELFDTLNASTGEGYLVYKALTMRQEDKTLEETLKYLNDVRNKITTTVIFDDLSHLKRGGRINFAKFALGSLLGIKPALICNSEGKIAPVAKIKLRGRKNAITWLKDTFTNLVEDDSLVMIVHSDAKEDAETLAKELKAARPKLKEVIIAKMGPVIGAHGGLGTLGLMYLGKTKDVE